MDPPIHTEYLRSGGAMILIFIVGGASCTISFCIRSAIPVGEKMNVVSVASEKLESCTYGIVLTGNSSGKGGFLKNNVPVEE